MGETEIRLSLNRAQDDFCAKTELIRDTYTQSSVAGQRYYTMHPKILKVMSVQINDVQIPRLTGTVIIDDDEFDSSAGLTAASSSSNERYWFTDSGRLGVVEKGTVTRDGKTSNYQSISEVKEIRMYAISQGTDFTVDLTEVSALPTQFHDALVYKVISDAYLKAGTEVFNPQVSQIFEGKYLQLVKDGKKHSRNNQIGGATIIAPTSF
tara:strand:- start:513 stop:1139 length:627 start_codon:yes stop_codon:yes gene_type:complete